MLKITGRRICYFGSVEKVDNNLITDKVKRLETC